MSKQALTKKDLVYVALDVEATGGNPLFHCTLSIGASVVTRQKLTFRQRQEKGLVFYCELRPNSLLFETAAMRVGCLHLECLEELRKTDARYNPLRKRFDPALVLGHMWTACEPPAIAMNRFADWLATVGGGSDLEAVVDTTNFDSVRVLNAFGRCFPSYSPFGYRGLDLDSLYRGYAGRKHASLRELKVKDTRKKPHKADHDSDFLAEIARVLLFKKMGW